MHELCDKLSAHFAVNVRVRACARKCARVLGSTTAAAQGLKELHEGWQDIEGIHDAQRLDGAARHARVQHTKHLHASL